MALHQTSGRAGLGFTLALTTTALWATLPVTLKLALEALDPITLTWFRFLVAFVAVLLYLWARGGLRVFGRLGRRQWILLAIAAAALTGNYTFYILGLDRTTPANSQLIIQIAPLLMAIGGIVVFKERFTAKQWGGAAVVVIGLGLFFRDQIGAAIDDADNYVIGTALIVAAAVTWAAYALAQKQLLGKMSSTPVLLFIFACASVALLPASDPSALLEVDALHAVAIAYCAVNTLGAYGAFANALAHWEASKVSLVLALNPLLTVGVATLAHGAAPDLFDAVHIETLGYAGAVVAVLGSAATSMLGTRRASTVLPRPAAADGAGRS